MDDRHPSRRLADARFPFRPVKPKKWKFVKDTRRAVGATVNGTVVARGAFQRKIKNYISVACSQSSRFNLNCNLFRSLRDAIILNLYWIEIITVLRKGNSHHGYGFRVGLLFREKSFTFRGLFVLRCENRVIIGRKTWSIRSLYDSFLIRFNITSPRKQYLWKFSYFQQKLIFIVVFNYRYTHYLSI